jgi:hypothetical protein
MALNKIVLVETKEVLEENVPEEITIAVMEEWEYFTSLPVMALPMATTTIKAA